MFKNTNRSRSGLSHAERIGIFYLIGLIAALIWLKTFSWNREPVPVLDPGRLEALRCELQDLAYQDSLRRLPKVYPFNPNFLTDAKGYRFGMSILQRDRLKAYRAEGNWIRSSRQFQEVTGVPDSILEKMQPYFKFPPLVRPNLGVSGIRLSKSAKKDINQASMEHLKAVNGIGHTFAQRILAHRAKQGPFPSDRALYEVRGVRPEAIDSLLVYFQVHHPEEEVMLVLGQATASDLATIPGVDFQLAKRIWEFHRLRGGVSHMHELGKIEGMTPNKLRRIELYLKVEKR